MDTYPEATIATKGIAKSILGIRFYSACVSMHIYKFHESLKPLWNLDLGIFATKNAIFLSSSAKALGCVT